MRRDKIITLINLNRGKWVDVPEIDNSDRIFRFLNCQEYSLIFKSCRKVHRTFQFHMKNRRPMKQEEKRGKLRFIFIKKICKKIVNENFIFFHIKIKN
jgi:hypothetical protein